MKNPKKLFAVLLVAVLLVSSFSSVFAADTISPDAKICADIGMLLGDGTGVTAAYTAQVPVRMQAAIMYLRLKGLYDEALAFTGTENFSDASGIYADGQKILAYLKANPDLGWVGNDGMFKPKDLVTAQQYYKVMLSALGYIQDLDFTWAEVFTFAADKGMSRVTADTAYTVDSLAIATVEALNAGVYGGTETLAGQLVTAGKLDATKVATAGLLLSPAPAARPIDSTATYMSRGENLGWQGAIYTLGDNTTGKQYVSFDMTALIEKVDASVDFADSQKEVFGFADLAMLVRMNDAGLIDVRNGLVSNKQMADVEFPYSANIPYHIEVEADMNAKTYSVWVTAPEGVKTQIAKDYGFRTSAAADTDDLGKVFFVSASDNNQMKVENFKRFAMIDSTAAYMSRGENMGWQSYGMYLGSNNTGKQQINFDMTPIYDAATIDGSVDFADSSKTVGGFSDLAMLVRMSGGIIDVRNGLAGNKQLFDTEVKITTGVVYHIEIVADMTAKTYSVWVTPDGGVKTQIAKDYGFRTSAIDTDDVGQVFFVSSDDNDWIKASNITIKAVQ